MPNPDHTPAEPDLDRLAKIFAEADAKEAALLREMSAKYGTNRSAAANDDRDLDR